jgi:hypothetical protein
MRQLESLAWLYQEPEFIFVIQINLYQKHGMWDMQAGKMPKVIYNHTHDRLSERFMRVEERRNFYVEEVEERN